MGNNYSSTVDYLEMYEIAGDIVGGIGNYVNSLKNLKNKVEEIKKDCQNFRSFKGNSRTVIEDGCRKECKVTDINDGGVLIICGLLLKDIDSCIENLEKMRNDANDCEYVADAIKKYTKKLEKGLNAKDKAEFWSKEKLSMDMYGAKKGSKVSISNNDADWNGVITFMRMPNGTYQVLKNGIVMGYTTAEGKKKYYKEVLSKTGEYKKYKNKLSEEKKRKDIGNDEEYTKKIINTVTTTIKGRKVPDKLVEWIKKDFSGKDIYIESEDMKDIYNKGLVNVIVKDKKGQIIGSYSYNKYEKDPSLARVGYDKDSSLNITKANGVGFGAGFVEGLATFGEDAIDMGARGFEYKARSLGDNNVANKLKNFADKKYVAEAFDKAFYESDTGKYVQGNSANPEFVRESGVISGKAAISYGVGKGIKAVEKASTLNYHPDVVDASSYEISEVVPEEIPSNTNIYSDLSSSSGSNAISNSEGM